jgi:hypothetical protein
MNINPDNNALMSYMVFHPDGTVDRERTYAEINKPECIPEAKHTILYVLLLIGGRIAYNVFFKLPWNHGLSFNEIKELFQKIKIENPKP